MLSLLMTESNAESLPAPFEVNIQLENRNEALGAK